MNDTIPLAVATDFNGSGGDPEPALRQIAEAGFTHLHWCHQWNTDHLYSDWEIARIAGLLRRFGLKLLDIHGSDACAGGALHGWYSTDECYRRAGVELVVNRLRMHAMLRGEGTLMMHVPAITPWNDTPEGRARFCRLNVSGAFNKDDPQFPGFKIWVFNNQGQGMVVKKRSRVDPALMENVEFDAEGKELSRSYEPA